MDCVFCKIVAGELPAERVHELPSWLAIRDTNPQAPVHVLVFPKEHVQRYTERFQSGCCGEYLPRVLEDVAKTLGLKDYRLIINNGPGAGQDVPHLHVHILGGWPEGQIPPIS